MGKSVDTEMHEGTKKFFSFIAADATSPNPPPLSSSFFEQREEDEPTLRAFKKLFTTALYRQTAGLIKESRVSGTSRHEFARSTVTSTVLVPVFPRLYGRTAREEGTVIL